ncbi:PQQ-dependent sugar dehydrogenase [Roseimicrobium sp. ORNL1]|uniref:PQQ-dependent sugar dehydrogenase n=1 Tax=Roseimicrobium sp. ORNL1 TaxID=2711231 RepID=UPI0013E0F131|nr:PQQ-dependent sugar dehydrogenase [Roseimicrobium sp. ORNL1]QIF00301.1 PQQ-dependent sugar dehydrogenase [Roseimicrobium sp. ORNL1]
MIPATTTAVRRVVGVGWFAALMLGATAVVTANPIPGEDAEVPVEIPLTDAARHYRLQRLYVKQRFDSPVAMTVAPLPEPRHVIMQQRGEVWVLPQDEILGTPERFLDFREQLKNVILFEEGFHGMAFHPDFAQNGKFYISYSAVEPRRTVISEMRVMEGNPLQADPGTERVLLELPHIMANHFAGGLAFGPDDKLYIAIGDGGMRDEPYRLAQNPFSLNGKLLRIDVDERTGNLPYGIPKDNPFADKQEWRPEIWALGLRNPWGFAFDRVTGHLWLADVGQDIWEEVNLIKKGRNYGWSDREGPKQANFHATPFLPDRKYEEPVYAYMHSEGVSITGGFVYRGERLPKLEGCYIYGDWGFGTLSALRYEPDSGTVQERFALYRRPENAETPFNPTMISEDVSGEIIIMSQEGNVYTLIPAAGE